jgi:hypothetical protein
MIKIALGAVALLTAASVQAAGPCGDGQMVAMRVSKLTATGTKAGFDEAVAAHKAWYAKAGLKDQFYAGPVLEPAKGGMRASDTQFVTVHVYGDTEPKRDAAWDDFVAKYKANSSIASETRYCLPKAGK